MLDLDLHLCDSWIPVSASMMRDFEKQLHFPLPSDYRRFLEKRNGGTVCLPVEMSLSSAEARKRLMVSAGVAHFNSIGCSKTIAWRDVLERTSWICGRIPRTSIAIASPGEDEFLLDLAEGHISYWDHEEHDREAHFIVAASFDDFLQKLAVDTEDLKQECSYLDEPDNYIAAHQHGLFTKWLCNEGRELTEQDLFQLFDVSCSYHNITACHAVLDKCSAKHFDELLRIAQKMEFADAFVMILEAGKKRSRRKGARSEYIRAFRDAWKDGKLAPVRRKSTYGPSHT